MRTLSQSNMEDELGTFLDEYPFMGRLFQVSCYSGWVGVDFDFGPKVRISRLGATGLDSGVSACNTVRTGSEQGMKEYDPCFRV